MQRLRYRRTQVHMNFPAQSKIKMYGPTYRKADGFPNNAWAVCFLLYFQFKK